VDEAEVTRRFGVPGRAYADFAVLRGDPSDGLPGVKGIGAKSAAALLGAHGSLEGIMEAARTQPGAGPLSRVAAALDYVERARQVVAIPRDLALPALDLTRPDGQALPEAVDLAAALNLEGAFDRLVAALAGTGPGGPG
jgi:5'-3' exonuclease